jgi:dihydrolipoamide dehydrogenase
MQFDILVIGSGPGGYVAAIKAAKAGKKVGLVEKAELGGVCLNWGCIPTKALLRSAELFATIKKAAIFGIQIEPEHIVLDYARVIKRSREVAGRLSKGVAFLMKKNKIETIFGTATLNDAHHVAIEGTDGKRQTVSADCIIIATGARTRDFPNMNIDGGRILGSREAMVLPQLPKSLAIVGAGAIGVEFAYFFQTMGCQVTLIEMLPHILPQEDDEVAQELEKSFKKQGVQILTGAKIEKLEKDDAGVTLHYQQDGQSQSLRSDYVLLAVGVQGNSDKLGLEQLGIAVEKSWIKVNEYYQTSVPNIYAIGDIKGAPWLAHVASAEGGIAVKHICHAEVQPLDYQAIPGCTYCHPQVASVGLSEKKAREAGFSVKVGHFPLRANGKALALGEDEGFVKIVTDARYGEILGCHVIGAEATEIISEMVLAKTLEATHLDVLRAVHPHPTISEAVVEAMWDALGQSLHI